MHNLKVKCPFTFFNGIDSAFKQSLFMKKLFLTCLLAVGLLAANAQYKHSIGLALGSPSGITYKTFLSDNKALDFTLGLSGNYFTVSAMYEIHQPIQGNLQWYYGPGAHIGSWNGDDYGSGGFFGIDGVIGIEFNPDIPFAFSLDLRPGINLIGNEYNDTHNWFFWQSQFGIKYTF